MVSFLIALDVFRWLNTFVFMIQGRAPSFRNIFYILAMVLPSVYAIVTWMIVLLREKRQELAVQDTQVVPEH